MMEPLIIIIHCVFLVAAFILTFVLKWVMEKPITIGELIRLSIVSVTPALNVVFSVALIAEIVYELKYHKFFNITVKNFLNKTMIDFSKRKK